MQIHPWHMLSGLGTMDRKDLCDMLSVFTDASLLNLVKDRLEDANLFSSSDEKSGPSAFQRRLTQASAELNESGHDDGMLRLMLWAEIRGALQCRPSVPLSLRAASTAAADVAQAAAEVLAEIVTEGKGEKADWRDAAKDTMKKAKTLLGLAETPGFDRVVIAQASRLMAEAAKEGLIDEAQKKEITEEFQRRLESLPPELRAEATNRAKELGDAAGLGLLLGGGGLIAAGIAVEAAGFGAYILAAQAATFIPLVGSKTAVSALFVLANPLFIVPAVLGGGWLAKSGVEKAIKRRLAAGLAVLLTLRGISTGRSGTQLCLDAFRNAKGHPAKDALRPYLDHVGEVRNTMGGFFPPSPGVAPGALSEPVEAVRQAEMERLLFPDRDQKMDVAAVATLTLGEIVYAAASIDPQVIAAADFSRTEDLGNVFTFGAFAERIGEKSGKALMGAESNLRGYIAEQIVAARLVERGHQVSFPETSNNAGYDLLVDGSEIQVKCLSDIGGLAEHFSKYPETAVIANAELAAKVAESGAAWKDQVFFIEGYDYGSVDGLLHDSINAGEELLDLDVPMFAVAVSAARNLHGWWTGAIPLVDVPFEVAVDGAVKGTLAVAGGLSGKALGLVLFGPAGAVIFGGVGGVVALVGAGRIRSVLDRTTSPKWTEELDAASRKFVVALSEAISRKERILDGKLSAIWKDTRPEAIWIRNRMLDDKVFLAEASVRVVELSRVGDPQERARAALRFAYDHAVHPWTVHHEMAELLRTLEERPSVRERVGKIWPGVASMKERFR